MDPATVVQIVGTAFSLGDVVLKCIISLRSLKSKYKDAPVHLTAMIGQMYMVQAALDQLHMLGQDSQFDHLAPQINDSLDSFSVLVLALKTELERFDTVSAEDMKMIDRATFLWSEKDLTQYSVLLDRQVNALNLLLQAVQCKTLQEQQDVLDRQENQEILELANDCSTSIVGMGDARSLVSENTANISVRFAFDSLILSTQIYQRAERSHLRQAIRSGRTDNLLPTPSENTLKLRPSFEAFTFLADSEETGDLDTIAEIRTIHPRDIRGARAMSPYTDDPTNSPKNPSLEATKEDRVIESITSRHVDTETIPSSGIIKSSKKTIIGYTIASSLTTKAINRLRFPSGQETIFTDARLAKSKAIDGARDFISQKCSSQKALILLDKSPPSSLSLSRLNRNLWPSEAITRISHRLTKSEHVIDFGLKRTNSSRSAERESKDYNVLVLGISESGKSTLLKAMEQELSGDPNDAEIRTYRDTTWSNVLDYTKDMLQVMDKFAITIGDEQQQAHAMVILSNSWSNWWPPKDDVLAALKALWSDKQFQLAYRQRMDNQPYDCFFYYCENMDRIAKPTFRPNDADILHIRVKTMGVTPTMLKIPGGSAKRLCVLDVGGSLIERRKWVPFLGDADTVIFVVDVTAYRTVSSAEGPNHDRMKDQLETFESLINSFRFSNKFGGSKDTEFILLLTKVDYNELRQMLLFCPPEKYFADLERFVGQGDYDWKKNDRVERYLQYLERRFLDLDRRVEEDGEKKRRRGVQVLRANLVVPEENPTWDILGIMRRNWR